MSVDWTTFKELEKRVKLLEDQIQNRKRYLGKEAWPQFAHDYHILKLDMRSVAAKYGVTAQTVSRACRSEGVPIRSGGRTKGCIPWNKPKEITNAR